MTYFKFINFIFGIILYVKLIEEVKTILFLVTDTRTTMTNTHVHVFPSSLQFLLSSTFSPSFVQTFTRWSFSFNLTRRVSCGVYLPTPSRKRLIENRVILLYQEPCIRKGLLPYTERGI